MKQAKSRERSQSITQESSIKLVKSQSLIQKTKSQTRRQRVIILAFIKQMNFLHIEAETIHLDKI